MVENSAQMCSSDPRPLKLKLVSKSFTFGPRNEIYNMRHFKKTSRANGRVNYLSVEFLQFAAHQVLLKNFWRFPSKFGTPIYCLPVFTF